VEDSRNKRRADRIRTKVDIIDVLANLGYAVRGGSRGQEEQFSCDLHGDGRDNKPSARVYPASNSWYCWACGRSRDAIGTVREKIGLGFGDALSWLEKEHGLPPMPWEPSDRGPSLSEELASRIDADKTLDDDLRSFDSMMDSIVADRMLPRDPCLAFWEARDKLERLASDGAVDDLVARGTLLKLRDRVLEAVKEAARA